MKIGIADNNLGKFTTDLMDRWRKDGHEVNYEIGFNPKLLEDSDVYFIDTCDNNAIVATRNYADLARENNLFIRLLDIETWVGHPGGVDWSVVNGLIFINDKIRDYTEKNYDLKGVNTATIHCGIDLTKFEFKESFYNTFKLAVVLGQGRIYTDKRLDDAFRILWKLRQQHSQNWELHVLGTNSNQKHYTNYLEYLLDELDIRKHVYFTNYVKNVDEWLNDKAFLIAPGMKEAFGYAIGEAMAKGITPIINNFWGAGDLWPKEYIYNDVTGAVSMAVMTPFTNAQGYRNFKWVADHYDFELFYEKMNKFMGVK